MQFCLLKATLSITICVCVKNIIEGERFVLDKQQLSLELNLVLLS